MIKNLHIRTIGLFFLIGTSWWGCNSVPPEGPFWTGETPPDTLEALNLIPDQIEGLHAQVFRPTCANAGCHDGNFEPDFRTIESTYSSLVLQAPIKNDPNQVLAARVQPWSVENSVLWVRLNRDIDGQSGIMPLVVDPDSDWLEEKTQHLASIRSWIEKGAPDMFGQTPQEGQLPPRIQGMIMGQHASVNYLNRKGGSGPVIWPASLGAGWLYLSLQASHSQGQPLQGAKVKFSQRMNDFEADTTLALLPLTDSFKAAGFLEDSVQYTHKVWIDIEAFPASRQMFVRVEMQDPDFPDLAELPQTESPDYLKVYFSFITP
ncbi:MAG: hypothetical protein AAFR61_04755 [Bacteroidota bacterium]